MKNTFVNLNYYNSIQDALTALENLSNKYFQTFKRKEAVELTVTVLYKYDEFNSKRYPDEIGVRCRYDNNTTEIEEMKWFVSNSK